MTVKDKFLKEKQKIYTMTENEREEFIYSAGKSPELLEFAKTLQQKVMAAIGQRPNTVLDDAELAEKKYLDAIEQKNTVECFTENYSIEVEYCDMVKTAFIAARWKLVTKIIGARRKAQAYNPHYYIDRLYRLFDLITKLSEKIFLSQQKKLPKEYQETLKICYEQVLSKYFDFFLEGVGRALENNDQLTVSRLRIVCSLHAGLVSGKQYGKVQKIPHLADQDKIIGILNECIKTMEKKD